MLILYHLLSFVGLDSFTVPVMQSDIPTTKHMATIPSSINHRIIQSASEVTWVVRSTGLQLKYFFQWLICWICINGNRILLKIEMFAHIYAEFSNHRQGKSVRYNTNINSMHDLG